MTKTGSEKDSTASAISARSIQVPAYQAAPAVYLERAYLQTIASASTNARKYVLLTTNTQDVLTFDLQDRIREDLLNLNVPPPKQ